MWEGYAHGKRAAWLMGEDYEALLHERIEAARRRRRIAEPVAYRRAAAALGNALASYASAARAAAA